MNTSYHKVSADASGIDGFCEARVVLAGGVATVTASSKAGKAPATVRMAGGLFLRRDTGEIIEPVAGSDGGGDRAHSPTCDRGWRASWVSVADPDLQGLCARDRCSV